MKRLLAGLSSLLVLAVLLIGIPAVLILVAGNPIPTGAALSAAVTRPDYGGAFLLGNLLPMVAWIAWATFAVSVLSVIPSTLRGVQPPRLPGLGFQQRTAATLLGAIIIMFTGLTGAGAPAQKPRPHPRRQARTPRPRAHHRRWAPRTRAPSKRAPARTGTPFPSTRCRRATRSGPSRSSSSATSSGTRCSRSSTTTRRRRTQASSPPTPTGSRGAGSSSCRQTRETTAAPNPTVSAASSSAAVPLDANTASPASTAPTSTKDEQHVVKPGDTLWGKAQAEYGDGTRYPEIFEASHATTQADGHHLSNPDLILPGWKVTVPGVAAAAPAPVPVPAQAPAPPPSAEADAAASATDAPAAASTDQAAAADESGDVAAAAPAGGDVNTSPAQGPPAASAPEDDDALSDFFASPTMKLGGIGSLLAAGLLGLLGIRRFQQRRNRKPCERISMPDPQTATPELELRAVADPQGVDDIDRALRFLAAWARETGAQLPKLFALRLSDDTVELYLHEAATLPEPFVLVSDDRMACSLTPAAIPDFTPRPTAPYPGLVTLGQDPANGHILVDLEQIGSLNIQGPDETTTEGALTALAIELACSKWADDLQITVVGFAPELADALNTGRVQYVEDARSLMSSLRGRSRAYTQAFEDLRVDGPQQARTTADTDTWTPEIVLLRHLPDD